MVNDYYSRLNLLSLLLGCALLAGCESAPRVMTFDMPRSTDANGNMWPAPPETPRYAYIGDLTGERNFQHTADQAASTAQSVWEFIAGIVGNEYQPLILERPQSVATDNEGNIYVTDVGQQAVVVFRPDSGVLDVWHDAEPSIPFSTPVGITLSNRDTLLVTDAERKRVYELSKAGTPIAQFGKDQLERPTGISQDPLTGIIYVADTQADNIKLFDQLGGLIDVIGAAGDLPGQFNAPTHLSFKHSSLYVADTLNARIQQLSADGEPLSVFGKRGINLGEFSRPKGVTVDSEGNIYAIESYYDHLLVFNAEGEFLLPIGGTGVEAGRFFLPAGVWIDSQDRVYVADMMNGRIAIFQYLGSHNE